MYWYDIPQFLLKSFDISKDDWFRIFQIVIPALFVAAGWIVALFIQFKANQKTLRSRTYLDASWDIRKSINETVEKSQPFIVDLMLLHAMTKKAKEDGQWTSEITSGWIKKLSWNDFIEAMDEHDRVFGLAPLEIIGALSKYDYLHTLEWHSFGSDVKVVIDEISTETPVLVNTVASLLDNKKLPDDDIIAQLRTLASKAEQLVYRLKKQSEAVEKTLARAALNVSEKNKLAIEKVKDIDFTKDNKAARK